MQRLTIARSQPSQDRPVKIYVFGEMGKCGELLLGFKEWIQFNKTLKEGIENLERKHELQMEIKIVPLDSVGKIPDTQAPVITSESVRNDIVVRREISEEEAARALRELEKETEGL